MEGGRERQSETHRQNVCWTYCVSACLGQEKALGQQHSGFEEEEEREKQPERVLVLPAGDRRKHWDSSTVALRRRKRESETHSQSVCWFYLPETGESTGTAAQWVWVWSGGRGEMRVGGERERNSPPEHVLDLLCLCLPGTENRSGTATQCGLLLLL